MMSGTIMQIESKTQFDETIASGLVLTDFWAPWCGPCRSQLPILEEIARKYAGKATVAKVNVDDNPDLSSSLKVEAIPTMFLFKNGTVVKRFTGVQKEDVLSETLDRFLA